MTKTFETVIFVDPVILIVSVFILTVVSISTLVIVYKIYKMHDVRNSDGSYAWMVPTNFFDIQKQITDSQNNMVVLIKEMNEQQSQICEILSNLVSETSSWREQKDVEKE
ncbi:MAG: hypothetical protein P8Y23_17535 [Candidatus Lokiarchaeota archaeon]|jgi:hypothetical protein